MIQKIARCSACKLHGPKHICREIIMSQSYGLITSSHLIGIKTFLSFFIFCEPRKVLLFNFLRNNQLSLAVALYQYISNKVRCYVCFLFDVSSRDFGVFFLLLIQLHSSNYINYRQKKDRDTLILLSCLEHSW